MNKAKEILEAKIAFEQLRKRISNINDIFEIPKATEEYQKLTMKYIHLNIEEEIKATGEALAKKTDELFKPEDFI